MGMDGGLTANALRERNQNERRFERLNRDTPWVPLTSAAPKERIVTDQTTANAMTFASVFGVTFEPNRSDGE